MSIIRYAFTGDWHSENMDRTYLVNGIPNRELDMNNQIIKMRGILVEKKIDVLVVVGDIFHKSRIDGYYYSKVVDYLRMFMKKKIKVVIMPGNHDLTESGSSITKAFGKLKDVNLIIIEKAQFTNFGGNCNFLILPHEKKEVFKEYKSYTEYVKNIIKGHKENYIIAGHFQPLIAVPGSEENMFSGSTRYLDTSIFGDRKIFCGHVHRSQNIGNIYIPGSIVRFDVNDSKNDKGIYLYNSEKDKVLFKKLNPQKISKVTIDFLDKEINIDLEKVKKYSGQMLVVNVNSSQENKGKINYKEIIDVFENVGAKVISYSTKYNRLENLEKSEDRGSMSPLNVMKRMISKHIRKDNRKRIFDLGKKILGEIS